MAKGSNFENEMLKTFGLWWTNGERDDVFCRTAGSGAKATCRQKKGQSTHNSCGDLGYLDEIGKPLIDWAVIEFKRGYTAGGRIDWKEITEALEQFQNNLLSRSETVKGLRRIIGKIKGSSSIIDALNLIDSNEKRNLLLSWWLDLEEKRKFVKAKASLLVFRRDGKKTCIMMETWVYYELCDFVNCSPYDNNHIDIMDGLGGIDPLIIMRLEDFFCRFQKEDIVLSLESE